MIIAALALHEGLRRNALAHIRAELERVIAREIGKIVDELVVVFGVELRRVRIGARFDAVGASAARVSSKSFWR